MGRKEEKKRNLTLDFARGFAILLMIYDHIIGHGKVITSFHMPLFFCFDGAAGIGLALLSLHLAETDQYHVTRFLDDPFPDEKVIKI